MFRLLCVTWKMRGLQRQLVAEDPRRSQKSRFSRRLAPSTFLAICGLFVRKLTRSPSRVSLALPSAWKTSCLHSKRIMHGRERELQCVATEVPGSSLDLLMVQDCSEQYALAASDDKFRELHADPPEHFALTFSISDVPHLALLVHRFRTWALLQQVMRCLASVSQCRFHRSRDFHFLCVCRRSSVLFHHCCKLWTHVSSKCHSTLVHPESRGERIDLVWHLGEFAPIPLRSPPFPHFLHPQGH